MTTPINYHYWHLLTIIDISIYLITHHSYWPFDGQMQHQWLGPWQTLRRGGFPEARHGRHGSASPAPRLARMKPDVDGKNMRTNRKKWCRSHESAEIMGKNSDERQRMTERYIEMLWDVDSEVRSINQALDEVWHGCGSITQETGQIPEPAEHCCGLYSGHQGVGSQFGV